MAGGHGGEHNGVGPAGAAVNCCPEAHAGEKHRSLRHELRTPLNQIIGYAEMLQEEAQEQNLPSFESDLKKIELAGRRLLDLINQLTADPPPPTATGTMSVRSESLRLPSSPPRSDVRGSVHPVGRIDNDSQPTGCILVVDDNEQNRDILARRLSHRGYIVHTEPDGTQALNVIATRTFDLVLLDVMMPGISGLEVLATLRKTFSAADLPIIMATALDSSQDVVEALRLGANDYVTKPLDMAVVLARVEAQLGLKRARDEVSRLNRQLSEAQDRISKLMDSSSQAVNDVTGWATATAAQVASAVSARELDVWLFEDNCLSRVTSGSTEAPSKQQVSQALATGQYLLRGADVLVPVTGMMGELFGTLVVVGDSLIQSEAAMRLLTSFARQLGGALELQRMRKELTDATERRRTTRQSMIEKGLGLLQLCPQCGRCYDQNASRCEADSSPLSSPRPFPFRVANRYQLNRLVGEGGMGSVFHAHDMRLGRDVAVKAIKAEHFNNDTIRMRFEQEARAVAKIDHPGVIAVFDSGELDDGSLYIVMEWLRGRDLAVLIKSFGRGTPTQVATLLTQAAAALNAAHNAGLVHRDIKPENIFLIPAVDGFRVKILDFGVAKEVATDSGLTRTGTLVGTPLFMSPEQILGKPIDRRSDLYSFAAVGYLALVGRRVTVEEEFVRILFDVVKNDPPPISTFLAGTPPEVDRAFAWALAKDPQARPSSAEEWVESFAPLLASIPCDWDGWADPEGQLRLTVPSQPELTVGSDITRLDHVRDPNRT